MVEESKYVGRTANHAASTAEFGCTWASTIGEMVSANLTGPAGVVGEYNETCPIDYSCKVTLKPGESIDWYLFTTYRVTDWEADTYYFFIIPGGKSHATVKEPLQAYVGPL
jgi:hypothetical protein